MRGFKVKVAAVNGAATNHAFHAIVLNAAKRFNVGHVGQATRCDHRNGQRLGQFDGGIDVDAGQHAVAADVGVNDRLDTKILELLGQINHVVRGDFAPAIGGDHAVLGVQAHDDMTAKCIAGVLQKTGVFNSSRANDDVTQAGVQIALDGVQVANAAAQLHIDLQAHFSQDFFDHGIVFGFARKGAVQVHQVQSPRAFGDPTARHGGGVFAENGGLIHVALFEANAVTIFQVNGGD